MCKKRLLTLAFFILFIPVLIFAQDSIVSSGDDVIKILENITAWLFRIFIIATVITFLIAGFYYITAAGDPTRITTANNMIKYGVIGVIVALLSGGMVALIKSFLET